MQSKKYKWKNVSEKEFINFINNYPSPLEQDFYMDWYSWNDFNNGKVWPESMVARGQIMYDHNVYQIKEYYE